jgi:hypothetical protein
MLESNTENLDLNTIGHYKNYKCSCFEKDHIEKAVENKCKLISSLVEIYSRFEHFYSEAHLRIAFFGSMSYPIAKYMYKLLVANYSMKLSINIFEKELKLCSKMLKKNIEEELKIGVFNFEPHETHGNQHAYNVVVCSDMLFMKENKEDIFDEFCRIMINGCFIIITDIFKKEGADTKDLEESLGIPPIDTLESLKDYLSKEMSPSNNISLVNSMNYNDDLKNHACLIDNTCLLENIDNLVYSVVIFKIN